MNSITWAHENAHVSRFHNPPYWPTYMQQFESQYIEAAGTTVVYDCNNSGTTTGAGAVAMKKAGWDTAIASLHDQASAAECAPGNANFCLGSETYAYGVSNPMFVPIWNQIPTEGAPTVGSVSPPSAAPGSQGSLTIQGQNLDANPVVSFSGSGISGSNSSVSLGQIVFNYSIGSGTPPGAQSLTVTTDNGTSNALPFTVLAAPTVTLNVSGPQNGTTYQVGDSFVLTISAPGLAGQPVTVSQNGGAQVQMGTTNSQGYWRTSGTWTSSNVGSYTQTWYVNGSAATPTLSFSIVQPPPVPTVTLTVTGPQNGTTYKVGDSFVLAVNAPGYPYQPVTVSLNGGAQVQAGTANSQGGWSTSGTWTSANVGSDTEAWYVNGAAATPTLAFTITQ